MKITTAIVLDTRRAFNKKKGTASIYPVKLRVTQQGRQKYYPVEKFSPKQTDFLLNVFALSKADFEKAMGEKPRDIHKERFLRLNEIEQRARKIIDDLPVFTFEIFEKHFSTPGRDISSVYAAYVNCIKRLKEEGRIGTAIAYQCSLQSLQNITGKKAIQFSDIDFGFLQDYERKMLAEGNSLNTVGIYIRCLRSLFNDAIEDGVVRREFYPFGKKKHKKYQIPSSKGKKKALLLSEVEKLYLYEHPDNFSDNERRSLDFWLFSYLCNGANIHDIARLKFKDISDNRITFIRTKTEHTTRKNLKSITVAMTPRMNEIIERWGNKEELPDNYVFSILSPGISPTDEKKQVAQAVKVINKYVKRIALELGITKPVTTYSARHSFASVLKRKGFSTEIISESLGHSDLKTTESYLDSFEDHTRIEISTNLTNFDKDDSAEQRKSSAKLHDFSPEPLKAAK